MQHRKTRRGFTLIEVLVVVLIIGILAAIALPMYNRAVLRSRFNALMPIVKAMNDSNEAYYLEHGSYASNPQDLPVQGQSSYPTGTELEFGNNMDYAYVLASNASARNNYIMYQKHSTNYPGEIHCEALDGDDDAQAVCLAYGTNNIGTTLTDGYTTYVIQGSGLGFPPGYNALLEKVDCAGAEALGFTCTQTVDEENNTVSKKICKTAGNSNYCRERTYNEDGSYTSITCVANAQNVCSSDWRSATYDANGNMVSQRICYRTDGQGNCASYGNSNNFDYTYDANGNMLTRRNCSLGSVDNNGNCTAYDSGSNYTYDANGNKLSERTCSSIDSNGDCTAYSTSINTAYDYTYDANGNKLTERTCSGGSVDSSGNCTAYASYGNYDYTYDANGNKLTERTCSGGSVDSSGNCTAYASYGNYDYTYDANGNRLTQRKCRGVDTSGNCTAYSEGVNYTYDANGNRLTERYCSSVDSSGNCTAYASYNNYDYTYDANGNQLTKRTCSSVDSSGNCTAYNTSGNYNYTYDANGNKLTERSCSGVDSSGNCTAYSSASYYIYDESGKHIAYQDCSGSLIDTVTGECTRINRSYTSAL